MELGDAIDAAAELALLNIGIRQRKSGGDVRASADRCPRSKGYGDDEDVLRLTELLLGDAKMFEEILAYEKEVLMKR